MSATSQNEPLAPWEAFVDKEHRPLVQSMRTKGEAEYIAGVNTEVDAPAQITTQQQEEVVEGASALRLLTAPLG